MALVEGGCMIKTKNEAEMGPRNIIVPGGRSGSLPPSQAIKQLNYMPIKHSDAVRNTYLTFGVGREGGRGGGCYSNHKFKHSKNAITNSRLRW